MNNIEMILKLMEPELTELQLAKLKNVLQTILKTSRNALPNEELIEQFIRHKKLVGLKDTSLTGYTAEIRTFMKYINKGLCDVTTADIKDYLSDYVEERKIAASTVQAKIRYLSSFFDFLTKEEFMDRNPTSKIERVMVEKKIRKAFTEEELDRLRAECTTKRDRALIEFLYSTGTRISECLALNIKDVNLSEGECIVFGKGHKERVVYLSNTCINHLQDYFEERNAQPEEPLFTHLTSTKSRVTDRHVQVLLRELGAKADVENVHPHRFRRTMATHLMDKGMPVEQIKEVLGHARLDTTMVYCNVNSGKVKASFKECFNNAMGNNVNFYSTN